MLFDDALTAAGLKTIGWNAAVSFFSLAHEVVYVEQKKACFTPLTTSAVPSGIYMLPPCYRLAGHVPFLPTLYLCRPL